MPFNLFVNIDQKSVKYEYYEKEILIEKTDENAKEEVVVKDLTADDYYLVKSYVPALRIKDLSFTTTISAKKEFFDYSVKIWDDGILVFDNSISEKAQEIKLDIFNNYTYVVLNKNNEINFIGNVSINVELDNSINIFSTSLQLSEMSLDVIKNTKDENKYSFTADYSGYYTFGIITEDNSDISYQIDYDDGISEGAVSNGQPLFLSCHIDKGDVFNLNLDLNTGYTVYRAAVSSPVWYSQSLATATSGSWTATNLNNLYYTTSTTLANSTISTDKPFYTPWEEGVTRYCFMTGGCALTCMAMLYRNRGAQVTRSYDYRGVSLSTKTADPFTLSLVNTSKTSATSTTPISGKNYYVVTTSPVYANWSTVASYFNVTMNMTDISNYASDSLKASLIASKIDSSTGGVIVYFESGGSTHYLLFTSYSYSNGIYSFMICDPAPTSYTKGYVYLDSCSTTICKLANAKNVRYIG